MLHSAFTCSYEAIALGCDFKYSTILDTIISIIDWRWTKNRTKLEITIRLATCVLLPEKARALEFKKKIC